MQRGGAWKRWPEQDLKDRLDGKVKGVHPMENRGHSLRIPRANSILFRTEIG
jgi:hypothetical protein